MLLPFNNLFIWDVSSGGDELSCCCSLFIDAVNQLPIVFLDNKQIMNKYDFLAGEEEGVRHRLDSNQGTNYNANDYIALSS